jgi:putative membrane protein
MTLEIILRYIHFISIFAIVGSLTSEHLLLKKEMTQRELDRVAKIDLIYGIAAISLLIAGLTLWFSGVGKPSVVYTKNWIFHIKLTLFVTVGLLSIYPTVFFLKKRGDQDKMITIPKSIFWLLRIEILLLFIIPLLAGLMSRGVGFFG